MAATGLSSAEFNHFKTLLGDFLTQMLCSEHKHFRTLRHRTGHHTGSHHGRGDDLPWFDVKVEALKLVGHHGLQSGGIVGGVFHRHAEAFGLADALQHVPPDSCRGRPRRQDQAAPAGRLRSADVGCGFQSHCFAAPHSLSESAADSTSSSSGRLRSRPRFRRHRQARRRTRRLPPAVSASSWVSSLVSPFSSTASESSSSSSSGAYWASSRKCRACP